MSNRQVVINQVIRHVRYQVEKVIFKIIIFMVIFKIFLTIIRHALISSKFKIFYEEWIAMVGEVDFA